MADVTIWEWVAFGTVVFVFLGVDLFAHRGDRPENRRQATIWAGLSIGLGLLFGGHVWMKFGQRAAEEYLAAYLLEEALSLDNLFVFLIIFRMMQIPKSHQRVALTWGILGALVFRAIFIFLGVEILNRWAWVELIFAVLLFYGAWHAVRENPADAAEDNKLVAWLMKHMRVSRPQEKPHFIVREDDLLKATPLLVAVIGLEASDVMFAIDSVPAAFSVTRNEFLIYSSNVFAILGLRSLYIVLAHTIAELRYLHYGLAAVLAFAGAKMVAGWAGYHLPPLWSVAIILMTIGTAVVCSLLAREQALPGAASDSEASDAPEARPIPHETSNP